MPRHPSRVGWRTTPAFGDVRYGRLRFSMRCGPWQLEVKGDGGGRERTLTGRDSDSDKTLGMNRRWQTFFRFGGDGS